MRQRPDRWIRYLERLFSRLGVVSRLGQALDDDRPRTRTNSRVVDLLRGIERRFEIEPPRVPLGVQGVFIIMWNQLGNLIPSPCHSFLLGGCVVRRGQK